MVQTKYRENVCENPYEFGDGLPRSRIMTAAGGRDRLDYMQTTSNSNIQNLPRIGSQSVAGNGMIGPAGHSIYQTLNS